MTRVTKASPSSLASLAKVLALYYAFGGGLFSFWTGSWPRSSTLGFIRKPTPCPSLALPFGLSVFTPSPDGSPA